MTERRYDEREVRAILALATRVEEETGSTVLTSGGGGMTLAELRSVAIEAGIDPDDLSRAVGRLDAVGLGDVAADVFTSTVDVELSEEGVAEMLDAARRFAGRLGKLEVRGGSQAWVSHQGNTSRYVTVTSRRGQTRLEVEHSLARGKLLHGAGSGLLGFFGSASLAMWQGLVDAPAIFTIIGLTSAVSWAGMRFWWGPKARRERDRLEAIFRRLEEELRLTAAHETWDDNEDPA